MNKREFLKISGLAGISAAMISTAEATDNSKLRDITVDSKPITVPELQARVVKAQQFMQKFGIDALLLEAGSALVYFTGLHWWRSERFTGAVIPAHGDIAYVTPYFEEPSVRESMRFGDNVRTWHEHENPFKLVATIE
jgi:Xaa-Pro aminopeptidase